MQGVLRSRGNHILFADADGATRFADVDKLETELVKMKSDSKACFTIPVFILIVTVAN